MDVAFRSSRRLCFVKLLAHAAIGALMKMVKLGAPRGSCYYRSFSDIDVEREIWWEVRERVVNSTFYGGMDPSPFQRRNSNGFLSSFYRSWWPIVAKIKRQHRDEQEFKKCIPLTLENYKVDVPLEIQT